MQLRPVCCRIRPLRGTLLVASTVVKPPIVTIVANRPFSIEGCLSHALLVPVGFGSVFEGGACGAGRLLRARLALASISNSPMVSCLRATHIVESW